MNRAERIKDLLRWTYGREPGEPDQTLMDERILADASTTMKQAVAAHQRICRTFLWRSIMKSNITKWATAAVIVIAVMVGINHFDSSIDGSSVALAEVIRSIQNANSAVWHEQRVMTCEGKELPFLKSDVVRYYSLEYGGKEEMYNMENILLQQVYWLPEENVRVEVVPLLKQYMRNEMTEAQRAIGGQSVEAIVELVKSEKSIKLGRKTINGREAEGFEIENSTIAGALVHIECDHLVTRLWIDIETSLPLRYETELVTRDKHLTFLTGGKAVEVKVIGDAFQWDMELEPSIFEPKIPPDYMPMEN